MKNCARAFFAGAVVAVVTGCSPTQPFEPRDRLLVSAAVSLSDAMVVVAEEYERTTGVAVVLNLAGSDTLATQLSAGVPADVFVSADGRQMDRAVDDGVIASDTRVDLLANQLVAIIGSFDGPLVLEADDLRKDDIRRIAMGDPDSVPAGVYARQYLESIGLWDDVRGKVVPMRDVRAALAVVAAGNADVGFVYRTDLVRVDGVSTAFEIPLGSGPPIRYSAAAIQGPREASAKQFLAFLQGPVARAAFQDAGFLPLTAPWSEALERPR